MLKLDLSELIAYVEVKKQKNENTTKYNLSSELLRFLKSLKDTNQDIKTLKGALLKVYVENKAIENEVKKLSILDKRHWSYGQLWYPPVDQNSSLNLNTINDFINLPDNSDLLSTGVPKPSNSWIKSKKLHNIIYNLDQQILKFEKKAMLENNVVESVIRSHCGYK